MHVKLIFSFIRILATLCDMTLDINLLSDNNENLNKLDKFNLIYLVCKSTDSSRYTSSSPEFGSLMYGLVFYTFLKNFLTRTVH